MSQYHWNKMQNYFDGEFMHGSKDFERSVYEENAITAKKELVELY
jgi:hypothetical protein